MDFVSRVINGNAPYERAFTCQNCLGKLSFVIDAYRGSSWNLICRESVYVNFLFEIKCKGKFSKRFVDVIKLLSRFQDQHSN